MKKQDMKPYVFSKKKYQLYKIKWKQDAHHIQFSQKKLRYQFLYQKLNIRRLSQLTFQYNFQYEDDQVFFAYCIPFSYSYLLSEIQHLNKYDRFNNQILQAHQLGKTLMGLSIPLLKITNPKVSIQKKKIILCTARIHPGQSNGSIVMHGLIKYLCSQEGQQLRNQSIFIIIPMLNPDGVVLGNYRTGAMGRDLNRLYLTKNKRLFPEILLVKDLVKNIQKQKKIYMFLDFHGHSEKKNIFLYGPSYNITEPQYYKSKLLARMISKKTEMFRFYSCIFKISQKKKSTGRAVMFQQFHIPYVFTIESSNGFFLLNKTNIEFNRYRWHEMGNIFGITINDLLKMMNQYEHYINQRKQLVIKRKSDKQKMQIKRKSNLSNQIQFDNIFKQIPKVPQQIVYLLSMIQEFKKQQKQKKIQDSQKDSDSDNPQDQFKTEQQQQFNQTLFNETNEPECFMMTLDINQNKIHCNNNKVLRKSSEYLQSEIDFLRSYEKSYENSEDKKPKSAYQRKRITSSYKARLKISKTIELSKQSSIKIFNHTQQLNKYSSNQQPIQVVFDSTINQINKTHNKNNKSIQRRKGQIKSAYTKINRKPLNPNIVLSTQSIFDSYTIEHHPNQIFTVPTNKQMKNHTRKEIKSKQRESYENYQTIPSKKSESIITQNLLFNEQRTRPLDFNFTKFLKNDQQEKFQDSKKHKMDKPQKRIYPSAFYRIKQQISGRKKQQIFKFQNEHKNLSLHIQKLN